MRLQPFAKLVKNLGTSVKPSGLVFVLTKQTAIDIGFVLLWTKMLCHIVSCLALRHCFFSQSFEITSKRRSLRGSQIPCWFPFVSSRREFVEHTGFSAETCCCACRCILKCVDMGGDRPDHLPMQCFTCLMTTKILRNLNHETFSCQWVVGSVQDVSCAK